PATQPSAQRSSTAPVAYAVRRYDVADLLIPIRNYDRHDLAPAQPLTRHENVVRLTRWLRRSLDPTEVDTRLDLREEGGQLILTASAAQHARAERRLRTLADGRQATGTTTAR